MVPERRIRVLLVEDNPGDVKLIKRLVAEVDSATCEVACRTTLDRGLKALAKSDFDVVLLDLGLPDSQGLDTLACVRVAAPDKAIVVLTGLADEETAAEALRRGAQDYVVKGQMDGSVLVRAVGYAVDRFQAEATLRASEERFRTLVQSMNDMVFTLDRDRRYSGIYGRWLTGRLSPGMFIGKTAVEALGAEDGEVHEQAAGKALKGQIVVYEWSSRDPDDIRHFQTVLSPMRDIAGDKVVGLVGVVRDITESKKAEESLRRAVDELDFQGRRMEELAKRVIEAQEDERRYLAGEIHDRLMQGLVATSYFLQSFEVEGLDARVGATRDKLVGVLNDSVKAGRGLLRDLEPIREPDLTLAQAIGDSVGLRFEDSGVEVDFKCPKDLPDVGWAANTNVLRIVQEALMNVRRHAKASRVTVSIAPEDGGLEVLVKDDGVGFDTAGCAEGPIGHYGLLTMQERARLVGGDLSVTSSPGKGTVVRGFFPPSKSKNKKSAPGSSLKRAPVLLDPDQPVR